MLLAIGAYPTKKNEKEGRQRRIHKVDEAFSGIKRRYLDISLRKFWVIKKDYHPNVEEYHLNFFVYLPVILYFGLSATTIYVHSMVNALYVLPIYLFHGNIITDMHGIIVEENEIDERHGGFVRWVRDKVYRVAEAIVVYKSRVIISVTENMKRYFLAKYHIKNSKIVVIPIFNNLHNADNTPKHDYIKPWKVIYAGGAHAWQCVDQMIQLIVETKTLWQWTILSNDKEVFAQKLRENHLDNIVTLKSVSQEEVEEYYKKNDFGVVLREEHIINRVACPTKLVEYMQNGLIPIVLTPKIGDFAELGYKYIQINLIDVGSMEISNEELRRMAEHNQKIIKKINKKTDKELKWLNSIII